MVAVQRRDTKEWAIPGGMVDAGETCSATVKREFMEEAGNVELGDEAKRARNLALVDELFARGEVVYRSYVDDPRNTDNAWMETTAFHFHCSDEAGRLLRLGAAAAARRHRRGVHPHPPRLRAGGRPGLFRPQLLRLRLPHHRGFRRHQPDAAPGADGECGHQHHRTAVPGSGHGGTDRPLRQQP